MEVILKEVRLVGQRGVGACKPRGISEQVSLVIEVGDRSRENGDDHQSDMQSLIDSLAIVGYRPAWDGF